jgi:hypothetical protein
MEPTKRELREAKRILKRKGNQRLRRQLKRTLAESPDEASETGQDYGRYESSRLNGMDHDATRRRK